MRAPAYSVLVIAYAVDAFAEVAYALRRGGDADGWHGLTGWGTREESAAAVARRITGVEGAASYVALDSRAMVAAEFSPRGRELPEYAFGVRVDPAQLVAPAGHEQLWASYDIAQGLLRRRAEHDALWELRHRLGLAAACR